MPRFLKRVAVLMIGRQQEWHIANVLLAKLQHNKRCL